MRVQFIPGTRQLPSNQEMVYQTIVPYPWLYQFILSLHLIHYFNLTSPVWIPDILLLLIYFTFLYSSIILSTPCQIPKPLNCRYSFPTTDPVGT